MRVRKVLGVAKHLNVCSFGRKKIKATYCYNIQDAEETMDTISSINLLNNTFFAILEDKNKIFSLIYI